MRILNLALTIVALAAPIASAQAEEAVHEVRAAPVGGAEGSAGAALAQDAGWNGAWALLFQLNSPFNGSTGMLGGYDATMHGTYGGLGFMYLLSPEMAARIGAYIGRTVAPFQKEKTVTETFGERIEEYTMSPTGVYTSTSDVQLRADMLYRLMPSAVAPYLGGGLFYNWSQNSVDYKDDVSEILETVEVHNRTRTQDIGLRALLGAEWRVHANFAIFAEYALALNVLRHRSVNNDRVVTVTDGADTLVNHTNVTSGTPGWMGLASGMTHNANVGLAIHFK